VLDDTGFVMTGSESSQVRESTCFPGKLADWFFFMAMAFIYRVFKPFGCMLFHRQKYRFI
jgi:hypothetical protein